jgi:3-oxoacyl-[acyl-carrier protein] reductase
LPWLKAAQGAVVNTASTAALRELARGLGPDIRVNALVSMTRELARGLGPDIRVNAIAPGIVEGSNWECRWDSDDPDNDSALVPLRRAGRPQDYAEAILFLCAGAAYITGVTLVVDGGMTA